VPNLTQRVLGAVVPGETAESVERKTEGATEGVVTGTPPPIAPIGLGGAGGALSGLRGAGAAAAGSAAANEAVSPGGPTNPSPLSGSRGVPLGQGGFSKPLGDLEREFNENTPSFPGSDNPFLVGGGILGTLVALVLGFFLLQAFAGGLGEGLAS
jgi:hypothetical protein